MAADCNCDLADGVPIRWKREYLVLRKEVVTVIVPRELVDNLDLDDGAMVLDEWICAHPARGDWYGEEEGIDNDDMEYGLADDDDETRPAL